MFKTKMILNREEQVFLTNNLNYFDEYVNKSALKNEKIKECLKEIETLGQLAKFIIKNIRFEYYPEIQETGHMEQEPVYKDVYELVNHPYWYGTGYGYLDCWENEKVGKEIDYYKDVWIIDVQHKSEDFSHNKKDLKKMSQLLLSLYRSQQLKVLGIIREVRPKLSQELSVYIDKYAGKSFFSLFNLIEAKIS